MTTGDAVERCLHDAPLFSAWAAAVSNDAPSFTIPGHKRRAGSFAPALGRLLDADVPLYGGLDTPKLQRGTLAEAERLAADLWQASWCRFSTGGSTHANQVLALAAGRPGATVLVARTAHRSLLSGLVLADLNPVWLPVEVDPRFGTTTGVQPDVVRAAVRDHADAVALFLVEPGYTGTVSDSLAVTIADAHAAGLAVIVDQAWGAHFGFHPDYPPHALALGADAMVASAHKTLPAFSQAAYVLARGDRFASEWLDRCFEASATTSPAGAVLASLDASRALLADELGGLLLERLAATVPDARTRLRTAGFAVPGPDDFPSGCFDPAKLVIGMGTSGRDGLDIERVLAERGMPVEMADRATVVPMLGLVDDEDTVRMLVDAILTAPASASTPIAASTWSLPATAPHVGALPVREAFFATHRAVPFADAIDEVCAEIVAPYPPGVPVLVPGERITEVALDALRAAQAAGSRIAYAADPTLQTLLVVERR